MKTICNIRMVAMFAVLLLTAALFMGGCTNIRPLEPNSQAPGQQVAEVQAIKVTYNYNGTDKVQLSANNLTLKVGQKLILEPAPGLSKNTRFTSSGEYFFGDIMEQDPAPETGRVVFTAKKAGKGKLQVIPNTDETARAVDLWVTVQ